MTRIWAAGGLRPAAISWFFENVQEGIILEDDCLPAQTFFSFCTSLLARYRNEPRVAHIGGFNCQFGRKRGNASYYFSRVFHCWGWATWSRAWKGFDFEMKDYRPFLAANGMERLFSDKVVQDFWRGNFDAAAYGDGSIWDYQWVYKNLKEERLAVIPNWNMVENIVFWRRCNAHFPPGSNARASGRSSTGDNSSAVSIAQPPRGRVHVSNAYETGPAPSRETTHQAFAEALPHTALRDLRSCLRALP